MPMSERFGVLLLMPLLYAYVVGQDAKPSPAPGGPMQLDVVVTEKSGTPVSGLQLEDFTLLDNKVPQTITSFEAVDGRQAHVEVVLVIDAVNVEARELAIEREEIKRFLKADQGRLAYPTTFAVLTETRIQFHLGSSQDGNAISSALDHQSIPRRSIDRDADRSGMAARFDSSFEGFAQLLAEERERPGRKLIVWISPNWPMLSDAPDMADLKKGQQILPSTIEISKQLREGQITLYLVDPSGTSDLAMGLEDPPVNHTSPADTETQSGGLALHPGNEMASALRRCVADATAYYEISFNPANAGQPNEYHHLEIRLTKRGLTARTTQGYYAQPPRAENFTAGSEQPGNASDNNPPGAAPADASNAVYAYAHPYLDWPLAQLTGRIPELKGLQPAPNQEQLPAILLDMGRTVDDFIHNIVDLIAQEDVTQEMLKANGYIEAKERFRDQYLILHHGNTWGASAEYRMDRKGNQLGPIGLSQGFLITSGYALSCIQFSTAAQSLLRSRFRYLGTAMLGSHETYALAFAQHPGELSFATVMRLGAKEVQMPTQGILWVDKSNFQILRMRSDLLAPNTDIQLEQRTTDVTFAKVRLRDVPNVLWLPRDVDVYIEISRHKFRNQHHYTNYRRYRVSVKIGAPQ